MSPLATIRAAALAAALLACSAPTDEAPMPPTPFEPGQVWTYSTRPGEEASRVVVCRIDDDETLGPIVHVHVKDVAIASPSAPDGVNRFVGHMPIGEPSLRASVVALESSNTPLPDYEEGYAMWKEAFDAGQAGIFTISLAETVDFLEQAANR